MTPVDLKTASQSEVEDELANRLGWPSDGASIDLLVRTARAEEMCMTAYHADIDAWYKNGLFYANCAKENEDGGTPL